MKFLIALGTLLIVLGPLQSAAQIPRTLSYQGVLSDTLGNPRPDGSYSMTFRLYETETAGSVLWEEHKTLPVKRGLFHAILGDLVPLAPPLKFDRPYWLGLQMDGSPEMSPRIRLTSVGYSLNSLQADTAKTALKVSAGQVVKSINGLKDAVTLTATGGGSISSSHDTIYIHASPAGGGVTGSGSAGQIAFWSGSSSLSGDGGLYWNNSSKRLGVGTSAPVTRFHLSSPTSSWGMMMLENSTAGDNEASIAFKKGSDATGADIWIVGVGSYGLPNSFVFGRNGARMMLTPDGSMGLGTTAPSAETKLHVRALNDNFGVLVDAQGTSGSEIGLHSASSKYSSLVKNAYWNAGAWNRFDISSGASLQEFWPGGDMVLRTAAAGANPITWVEGVSVRTSGNVGVGTANPVSRLHVRGTMPTYVTIEAPSGSAPGINLMVAGTTKWSMFYHPVNGYLSFYKEGVGDKMIIKDNGDVVAYATMQCAVLKLTGGSDIAEPFDIVNSPDVEPGTVVVIDPAHAGRLRVSWEPYDHCVAGIISGAGGIAPAVVMGQHGSVADGHHPVAVTGRVYCRAVDANGPIRPGDLLTTSGIAGCAMKATDRERSQGAVLGKAMSSLDSGEGLVLVLVTLQ